MASNSSAMATASTAASVANGGGLYHVHHVPHHYQQEPYELSQDLIAKNLEVLEKKYGGSKKAKEDPLPNMDEPDLNRNVLKLTNNMRHGRRNRPMLTN